MTTTSETVATTPLLVETKLYRLNSAENFLDFLGADINTQMLIESEIDLSYPRTDDDGDSTRIFVNYTNQNGKSLVFKVVDNKRLASTFDIDSFINGYFSHVNEGSTYEDLVGLIRPSLVVALNTALVNIFELGDEPVSVAEKNVSTVVFQSLIAILLNDPKDAIVLISEQPIKDTPNATEPVITGVWTVKTRD